LVAYNYKLYYHVSLNPKKNFLGKKTKKGKNFFPKNFLGKKPKKFFACQEN